MRRFWKAPFTKVCLHGTLEFCAIEDVMWRPESYPITTVLKIPLRYERKALLNHPGPPIKQIFSLRSILICKVVATDA